MSKVIHHSLPDFRALINMDGIHGTIDFTQRSPFDPTWTNFQLGAADGDYESNLRFVSSVLQYRVHELPPKLVGDDVASLCNTTGGIYNPSGLDLNKLPPPGEILLWHTARLATTAVFCFCMEINL